MDRYQERSGKRILGQVDLNEFKDFFAKYVEASDQCYVTIDTSLINADPKSLQSRLFVASLFIFQSGLNTCHLS